MIPSQVQVELDQEKIKQYIKEKLDEQMKHEYIFIDVVKLEEMTSCSRKWLENELLSHPKVRLCERRKNRKRLYLYPDVVEAIREIADEEW